MFVLTKVGPVVKNQIHISHENMDSNHVINVRILWMNDL